MRSLEERLRRLEEKIPPHRDGEFDIEQVLAFRIAGMPRCIARAREIFVLDEMAKRSGCPILVQDECRWRIAAMIPACRWETSNRADDPRPHEERCRVVMADGWKIVREFEVSADG